LEAVTPLAIDLFAGLGGWAEGLLAEGYDVVGFDIEQHVYGEHRYPGLLVIQDVLTLHGSQFKDATLIVASPPCQGYSPQSYVDHVRQYGARLIGRMWVGVGSVCKRNADPFSIEAVLVAIKRERPDLRLHGFGVKFTALGSQLVRDLLFSADSMAWSFAARYEGRDGNDPAEAVRYGRRVATMATQLHIGLAS
jgi:hypothetical protein